MFNFIKNLGQAIHRVDPVHECLINALQMTIPGLIGAFIWLYFVEPFTTFIVILPATGFLIVFQYAKYKDKIINIIIFLSYLAAAQLIVASLIKHTSLLVFLMFSITFPVIVITRFRISSMLALCFIAVYSSLPGGVYNGINRVIELCIICLIIFSSMFLFEYIFARFRLRVRLVYLLELLTDAFKVVTVPDDSGGVINRHLFNFPLSFRSDFEVEKVFESHFERFFHRVYIRFARAARLIDDEEFFMVRNRDYQMYARDVFIQCRRIYRDLSFMPGYAKNTSLIQELIPGTGNVISNIGESLISFSSMLKSDGEEGIVINSDSTILERWLNDYEMMVVSSGDRTLSDEVIDFMYGLKCMIEDVRKLELILDRGGEVKIIQEETNSYISYIHGGLCISIAFCIGFFVELSMQIERGYWIPMMVGTIFMSFEQGQGAIIRKSVDLLIGTFCGACLGFIYVNLFLSSNYVWVYLLPFIWFTGYYFFFLTGNYSIYSVMITVFLPILIAISNQGLIASLGMGTTLFMRLSSSVIGALIALSTVYVIYRNTLTSARAMRRNTSNMFKAQGEVIRLSAACYLGFEFPERQLLDYIWKLNSSLASIENLFMNIKYEFDDKSDRKHFYCSLFTHIARMNRCSRRLVGIMVHDKYSGKVSSVEKLKESVDKLYGKYCNIVGGAGAWAGDCTERIADILKKMDNSSRQSPDYIFIRTIYELSVIADELEGLMKA